MLGRKISVALNRFSPCVTSFRRCSPAVQGDKADAEDVTDSPTKPKGFHQAFLKFSQMDQDGSVKDDVSFATLMRHSKIVDLGDPAGKIVSGTIFHVVNNDLYIDFGGKFHCVCTRPSKNGQLYIRGSVVKLRLKELELSTKFLGSDKDMSLLEADAELLGLISTPRRSQ